MKEARIILGVLCVLVFSLSFTSAFWPLDGLFKKSEDSSGSGSASGSEMNLKIPSYDSSKDLELRLKNYASSTVVRFCGTTYYIRMLGKQDTPFPGNIKLIVDDGINRQNVVMLLGDYYIFNYGTSRAIYIDLHMMSDKRDGYVDPEEALITVSCKNSLINFKKQKGDIKEIIASQVVYSETPSSEQTSASGSGEIQLEKPENKKKEDILKNLQEAKQWINKNEIHAILDLKKDMKVNLWGENYSIRLEKFYKGSFWRLPDSVIFIDGNKIELSKRVVEYFNNGKIRINLINTKKNSVEVSFYQQITTMPKKDRKNNNDDNPNRPEN